MSGAADPKSGPRIVDQQATFRALLLHPECAACGERATNGHHILQKGSPHFGDDVVENIVGLCGTGTMRCHGAIHGSPYVVTIRPDPRSVTRFAPFDERRDSAWVARRIRQHIVTHRPDVNDYLLRKLGNVPAWAFLERFYPANFPEG